MIHMQILFLQQCAVNSFQCVKSAEEKNSKYNYVDESDLKESLVKEPATMDSD